MRTTLTLDSDVAEKLKSRSRKSGKSFKALVNELLRLALNVKSKKPSPPSFVVRSKDMKKRLGVSLDNIGDLLESIEGSK